MTTPEPIDLPALEAAQGELAAMMAPWPDDWMGDLSPVAALLVLRQTAMVCLSIATGAMASLGADAEGDQPVASEVLNGVSAAVAGVTHALVALEALPAGAEEAMVTGLPAGGWAGP